MADYARGQRLRDLRDARHLSQADAAHEIGVSEKSVRSWEHGGKIKWPNAKRAAAFYGVDPETLVAREEAVASASVPGDDSQLDRLEAAVTLLLEVAAISLPGPDSVLEGEVARVDALRARIDASLKRKPDSSSSS